MGLMSLAIAVLTLVPYRSRGLTSDEARSAAILARTPMNRFGEADELVGATLLLASPRAGAFITGIELVVDGGFNAMSI